MITKTQIIPAEDNHVVSLQTVKDHLRVGDSEDALIGIYLSAAQEHAENYIGRAVGMQSLVITCDGFESVQFPTSTDDQVESVKYFAPDSEEYSTLESGYVSKTLPGGNICLSFSETVPATAVRTDAVEIRIKRGYSLEACPKAIVSAVLLIASDLYERREDRGEIGYNSAVHNLLRAYRKW